EAVEDRRRAAVVPRVWVGGGAAEGEVAVAAEGQALGKEEPAAAGGDKGAQRRPRAAVVAQDLVGAEAADEQIGGGGAGEQQDEQQGERGEPAGRHGDSSVPGFRWGRKAGRFTVAGELVIDPTGAGHVKHRPD